ncbi:MAG: hypothetical protein JWO82_1194, partial [Akkermansiaceae bacterium]|nr:hypothetical protein [Akkermansiaceae bacterium]
MVAAFTTRVPDFAAEVAANVQRTRSLPPAPDLPGDHHFYRVTANPYLDSDADGSPDWLEFATAAFPTPGEPPADPFNGDADANGVSDGAQKDSDGDGIPDDQDVSKGDSLMAWSKNEPMLFACFSLGNNDFPYQVNDQGIVLYQHSIWKNG